MSNVAQFGWLEWPVAVHWGDIMFTLVYTSKVNNQPSLATVTSLPQTQGFNQHSAVNVGKPPKYSTYQTPSTSGTATATGWLSAVHALQFGQPPKFCVSIPGPPPAGTITVPIYYAWRTFGVGSGSSVTLVNSFAACFAYQNDPTIQPWCFFPAGGVGIAESMGPACVAAGTREAAQSFLDWQNSHCGIDTYSGPDALPSGVEEVDTTGKLRNTATGGARVTTTKKGVVIDTQEWDGHASSDNSAANAQVCFTIDNKGKISMTVSAPGWAKGPEPAG